MPPLIALAGVIVLAMLVTWGSEPAAAEPSDEPIPSPLYTMEFQAVPGDFFMYPTRNWWASIKVQGWVAAENYRPEDAMVYLDASLDHSWFVMVDPPMFTVPTSRLSMESFVVTIQVPPHTFGPDGLTLTITAEAKTTSRTLMEVTSTVNLHFVSDVEEMIDGMGTVVTVFEPDMAFAGRLRLNNMLDRPQEFHLCAMGEWADRIPDLDLLGDGVQLAANEQRETSYLGHLEGDVELGIYRVELALWTPDGEGGRTFILNRTVEMEVVNTDTFNVSFLEEWLLVIVIVALTAVGVTVLTLRMYRRRQRARLIEEYQAYERNDDPHETSND